MSKTETIIYDGKRWNRYPESKRQSDRVYFKRSVTGGSIWLHRYIWEKANGAIPKGSHIHHKDGDTLNNDLSNLECLTPSARHKEHPLVGEALERQLKHLNEIREKTKEWHASKEGHEWHKAHAKAHHWGVFDLPEKKCAQCGKTFKPKSYRGKFCSNACKSAWRRDQGLDNVERICAQCGKVFTCNKYSKHRFCSKSCARRYEGMQKRKTGL